MSTPTLAYLLRTPIEEVAYLARVRQKTTDRDLAAALGKLDAISAGGSATAEEVDEALNSAISELRALKRRVSAHMEEDEAHLRGTRRRLEHYAAAASSTGGGGGGGGGGGALAAADGSSSVPVLDDLLFDYMQRQNLHASAAALAEASALEPTMYSAPRAEARAIVAALAAGDAEPALEWCAVHRSRLKKQGSRLECLLHVRNFAALVASAGPVVAVGYARKHFPKLLLEDERAAALVRSAMGSLAARGPMGGARGPMGALPVRGPRGNGAEGRPQGVQGPGPQLPGPPTLEAGAQGSMVQGSRVQGTWVAAETPPPPESAAASAAAAAAAAGSRRQEAGGVASGGRSEAIDEDGWTEVIEEFVSAHGALTAVPREPLLLQVS